MKSSDIPKVEQHLSDLDDAMRRIQGEVQGLGEILESLAETCRDEPDLLEVMKRERRYLRTLRAMLEDFPIIRQMRRRLPVVEGKIRRREREGRQEDANVQRQAEDVRSTLEDILQQFLR